MGAAAVLWEGRVSGTCEERRGKRTVRWWIEDGLVLLRGTSECVGWVVVVVDVHGGDEGSVVVVEVVAVVG